MCALPTCLMGWVPLIAFQLYVSMVEMSESRTYDMYTPVEHTCNKALWTHAVVRRVLRGTLDPSSPLHKLRGQYGILQRVFSEWESLPLAAVGITQGVVHTDEGQAANKSNREKHFPLELIDHAVSFNCQEGGATVHQDKVDILSEIGDQATLLDEKIHAVAAGAVLERVLKENDERRYRYLESVRKGGPPRQVSVDLSGSNGDSQENVTALIEALAGSDEASKCEELWLTTDNATELPQCLGRLTGLQKLYLRNCSSLARLPDSMCQMVALEMLSLDGCNSLVDTVELPLGVNVDGKPAGLSYLTKAAGPQFMQ